MAMTPAGAPRSATPPAASGGPRMVATRSRSSQPVHALPEMLRDHYREWFLTPVWLNGEVSEEIVAITSTMT